MALARFVVTALTTITWPATWSQIIAGSPATPVVAPTVPNTTVAAGNATGVPVLVVVTGATVTAVTVNGTLAGAAAGSYVVPYPGTIALTYASGSPTWTWVVADLESSGTSSMTCAVSATAPPGGQAGTLPQVTFIPGTVIYADSSAGSNGPQQLYQAIGAGNLRAYVVGQDAVGHAALSN